MSKDPIPLTHCTNCAKKIEAGEHYVLIRMLLGGITPDEVGSCHTEDCLWNLVDMDEDDLRPEQILIGPVVAEAREVGSAGRLSRRT